MTGEPLMSLAHAHDALADLPTDFHNFMLRSGIKELPAKQWAEEFRSWIDVYEFERRYIETLKHLSRPAEGRP